MVSYGTEILNMYLQLYLHSLDDHQFVDLAILLRAVWCLLFYVWVSVIFQKRSLYLHCKSDENLHNLFGHCIGFWIFRRRKGASLKKIGLHIGKCFKTCFSVATAPMCHKLLSLSLGEYQACTQNYIVPLGLPFHSVVNGLIWRSIRSIIVYYWQTNENAEDIGFE